MHLIVSTYVLSVEIPCILYHWSLSFNACDAPDKWRCTEQNTGSKLGVNLVKRCRHLNWRLELTNAWRSLAFILIWLRYRFPWREYEPSYFNGRSGRWPRVSDLTDEKYGKNSKSEYGNKGELRSESLYISKMVHSKSFFNPHGDSIGFLEILGVYTYRTLGLGNLLFSLLFPWPKP